MSCFRQIASIRLLHIWLHRYSQERACADFPNYRNQSGCKQKRYFGRNEITVTHWFKHRVSVYVTVRSSHTTSDQFYILCTYMKNNKKKNKRYCFSRSVIISLTVWNKVWVRVVYRTSTIGTLTGLRNNYNRIVKYYPHGNLYERVRPHWFQCHQSGNRASISTVFRLAGNLFSYSLRHMTSLEVRPVKGIVSYMYVYIILTVSNRVIILLPNYIQKALAAFLTINYSLK